LFSTVSSSSSSVGYIELVDAIIARQKRAEDGVAAANEVLSSSNKQINNNT
jgi:hypothetical protein